MHTMHTYTHRRKYKHVDALNPGKHLARVLRTYTKYAYSCVVDMQIHRELLSFFRLWVKQLAGSCFKSGGFPLFLTPPFQSNKGLIMFEHYWSEYVREGLLGPAKKPRLRLACVARPVTDNDGA